MATTDNCSNRSLYEGLPWCQGSPVLPGIRGRVYYIAKRDIVKWPTLPTSYDPSKTPTAETMGRLATFEGNFVLAADKKWLVLDVVDKSSSLSSEAQGEQPCITSLNKATFVHPGTKQAITAFCKQANCDDIVYIVFEKTGEARVLGNDMYQTTTKAQQNSGSSPTDNAGTTVEVEVTDLCPAPFYPGKIETEEGDISGADGKEWDATQTGG